MRTLEYMQVGDSFNVFYGSRTVGYSRSAFEKKIARCEKAGVKLVEIKQNSK